MSGPNYIRLTCSNGLATLDPSQNQVSQQVCQDKELAENISKLMELGAQSKLTCQQNISSPNKKKFSLFHDLNCGISIFGTEMRLKYPLTQTAGTFRLLMEFTQPKIQALREGLELFAQVRDRVEESGMECLTEKIKQGMTLGVHLVCKPRPDLSPPVSQKSQYVGF